MENCYKRMPNDVEMPAVSDDQQAFLMEERAFADIYKARRERRERILRESVPLFIRNKERILADEKTARCHIDGIRFGLAYSGEWKMPVVFLGGLLRLWENPLFRKWIFAVVPESFRAVGESRFRVFRKCLRLLLFDGRLRRMPLQFYSHRRYSWNEN